MEAGHRTGNLKSRFAEEMRRRVIACLIALHLVTTRSETGNLTLQGIFPSAIEFTGNPAIDALRWTIERPAQLVAPELESVLASCGARRLILVVFDVLESQPTALRAVARALENLAQVNSDVHIVVSRHRNRLLRLLRLPCCRHSTVWQTWTSLGRSTTRPSVSQCLARTWFSLTALECRRRRRVLACRYSCFVEPQNATTAWRPERRSKLGPTPTGIVAETQRLSTIPSLARGFGRSTTRMRTGRQVPELSLQSSDSSTEQLRSRAIGLVVREKTSNRHKSSRRGSAASAASRSVTTETKFR